MPPVAEPAPELEAPPEVDPVFAAEPVLATLPLPIPLPVPPLLAAEPSSPPVEPFGGGEEQALSSTAMTSRDRDMVGILIEALAIRASAPESTAAAR